MKNKFHLFKSLLFAALLCMLTGDAFLWLTSQTHRLSEAHKNILLTAFVVWCISVFLNIKRDDDLAGEF